MEHRMPEPSYPWPDLVHRAFRDQGVSLVGYVPDAGLKKLLESCQSDETMTTVPLTTEEEGVGLSMGAWLGGARSALLLQSSGVGNLINALGAVAECRMPLFMLVTMRGEEGEFNPWQVPMGKAAPTVLEAMGVRVERADEEAEVGPLVRSALQAAFEGPSATAVLISQRVVGIKSFQEQADR
jgi:sulfopyruvate decarboxylase alpha subunit